MKNPMKVAITTIALFGINFPPVTCGNSDTTTTTKTFKSRIEKLQESVGNLKVNAFAESISQEAKIQKIKKLYPNVKLTCKELIDKVYRVVVADDLINYAVDISGVCKEAVTCSFVTETNWFRSKIFVEANNLGGVKALKGDDFIWAIDANDGKSKFTDYSTLTKSVEDWSKRATADRYFRLLKGNGAMDWFFAWQNGGYWSVGTNGLNDRVSILKLLFPNY